MASLLAALNKTLLAKQKRAKKSLREAASLFENAKEHAVILNLNMILFILIKLVIITNYLESM